MISSAELFPGYNLIQDDNFFKLGQDSALLSDFLKVRRCENAVDLGAGCGALSLLSLIRNGGFALTAVELEPEAAALCTLNIKENGFAARAQCLSADLRALPSNMYGKYDVCMSNPPYFSANDGSIAQNTSIAAARSELTADLLDICSAAQRLLKWGGRFYVCYKPDRLSFLMSCLQGCSFEPKIMRFVHQKMCESANLVMVDARKGGGKGLKIMPPLIVCDENGQKTEQYKNIYTRRNYDGR